MRAPFAVLLFHFYPQSTLLATDYFALILRGQNSLDNYCGGQMGIKNLAIT
jgi:hypothetical protein